MSGDNAGPSGSQSCLLPEDTVRVVGDPTFDLRRTTTTPTPTPTPTPTSTPTFPAELIDSGSEVDDNCAGSNDDYNFRRRMASCLRYCGVGEEEGWEQEWLEEWDHELEPTGETVPREPLVEQVDERDWEQEWLIDAEQEMLLEWEEEERRANECENVMNESSTSERVRGARRGRSEITICRSRAAAPVNATYTWSDDFSSFIGEKELYTLVPGPNFSSQDPVEIFCEIWDRDIMETVARETNLYAWQVIAQFSDPDMGIKIPDYLDSWTEVTVEELYRYFAVLVFLSLSHRPRITDYWSTGLLGMPDFRKIMSRNKFFLIQKFLHFVSNVNLLSSGYDRKIEKVAPILDHCNRKFAEMYCPSQNLSLDESLLLWKGRLSWRQCIRSKAARFGIKSFELCDAPTGYLLQFRLYTGKRVEMHPQPSHGFQDTTSKVVLDLMEGYLDVGHLLVMDNWYNQLPLTRYLKSRRTDVLGTINRRRSGIPKILKDLIPNHVHRGTVVGTHSGDVALIAWKDVKLVTVVSTYHKNVMVRGRRAGQEILKPSAVEDYNRYMGGVDLKDQKISAYPMERKRNLKWYMKVFRRMLNTSLLNAFIIYSMNPMYQTYSHRDFRLRIAEGLISRYPPVSSIPSRVSDTSGTLPLRLRPGNHYPVYTEVVRRAGKEKRKQFRCVRCTALRRRVVVTVRCKLCNVPLCIGTCWEEYHSVKDLRKSSES